MVNVNVKSINYFQQSLVNFSLYMHLIVFSPVRYRGGVHHISINYDTKMWNERHVSFWWKNGITLRTRSPYVYYNLNVPFQSEFKVKSCIVRYFRKKNRFSRKTDKVVSHQCFRFIYWIALHGKTQYLIKSDVSPIEYGIPNMWIVLFLIACWLSMRR